MARIRRRTRESICGRVSPVMYSGWCGGIHGIRSRPQQHRSSRACGAGWACGLRRCGYGGLGWVGRAGHAGGQEAVYVGMAGRTRGVAWAACGREGAAVAAQEVSAFFPGGGVVGRARAEQRTAAGVCGDAAAAGCRSGGEQRGDSASGLAAGDALGTLRQPSGDLRAGHRARPGADCAVRVNARRSVRVCVCERSAP